MTIYVKLKKNQLHFSQLFFTGRYYYMEATGRHEGQRARLQSNPYQLYYKACLTFYYYIFGSDMGTLKILLNDQVVWQLDGNQGDQWHIANIPILHPGLKKVNRETLPYIIAALKGVKLFNIKYFIKHESYTT